MAGMGAAGVFVAVFLDSGVWRAVAVVSRLGALNLKASFGMDRRGNVDGFPPFI